MERYKSLVLVICIVKIEKHIYLICTISKNNLQYVISNIHKISYLIMSRSKINSCVKHPKKIMSF